MPPAPEDLTAVHEAMQDWRQGDVFEADVPLLYLQAVADPGSPGPSDIADLEVVEAECARLAVITQSCDLVKPPDKRPFLQVAEVVQLDGDEAHNARTGSQPRYVPLPGLDGDWFIDMDVVTTVEKAAVFNAARTRGADTEDARRLIADRVGRVASRPALDDDLNKALKPFVTAVAAKHPKAASDLGELFRDIAHMRVTVEDGRATVHLVYDEDAAYVPPPPSGDLEPSGATMAWFDATVRNEPRLPRRSSLHSNRRTGSGYGTGCLRSGQTGAARTATPLNSSWHDSMR